MIENLLMYTCAKHCHKRWSSDKAIAKKTVQFFWPHSVHTVLFKKQAVVKSYYIWQRFFLYNVNFTRHVRSK